MTENKRYDVIYEKEPRGQVVTDNGIPCTARTCVTRLNRLTEENEQLKQFKEQVFQLIDMRIAHYEHQPYSAPISNPANPNFDEDVDRYARLYELKQLKKELSE